jgi:hypothetical protein
MKTIMKSGFKYYSITFVLFLAFAQVHAQTPVTSAPLIFSTNSVGRKLVMWENAANDHQYLGLAINGGMLRYQVGVNTDDHVFYSAASSTASNELFRIKGNGKIGIGVNPNGALQLKNEAINRKIVLFEDANNDHQFYGFGINSNTLRYQTANSSASHVFYAATSSTASVELFRITPAGMVGIGNISSPSASLHVARGTGNFGTAAFVGTTYTSHFNNSTTEETYIRGGKAGSAVIINDANIGNIQLVPGTTGKVGIGISAPVERLHLNAGIFQITGDIAATNTNTGLRAGYRTTGTAYSWLQSTNTPIALNPVSNYVAIGFIPGTYPVPAGYNLAVKGNILCEEMKVKLVGTWPDYVFDQNYKLRNLEEVEAYVKENKHLPEVPTAQEVKDNGILTGEMHQLLLKKVEELTLYLIEQNKQLNELKAQNEELAKKVSNLSK